MFDPHKVSKTNVCVCVWRLIYYPRGYSPHKDSKNKEIIPHGDISQIATTTKAILGLGLALVLELGLGDRFRSWGLGLKLKLGKI